MTRAQNDRRQDKFVADNYDPMSLIYIFIYFYPHLFFPEDNVVTPQPLQILHHLYRMPNTGPFRAGICKNHTIHPIFSPRYTKHSLSMDC